VDSGETFLDNVDRLTISAWANPAGFSGTTSFCGQNDVVEFGFTGAGQASAWMINGGTTTGGVLTPGGWYYISLIRDATNARLFYDGVLEASGPRGTAATSGYSVKIGAGVWSATGQYFNGTLDEVRVSTVDRSADWIWAEWMNMSGNTTFQDYGVASHARPASAFIIK